MPTPEKMAAEYGQVKGIPSRCSSNVIFPPLTLHCIVQFFKNPPTLNFLNPPNRKLPTIIVIALMSANARKPG